MHECQFSRRESRRESRRGVGLQLGYNLVEHQGKTGTERDHASPLDVGLRLRRSRRRRRRQAAGTIHTDFERGFICAEVMKYNELHELGDEKAVKEAGKYRQEGKNYVVNDADVIFFK